MELANIFRNEMNFNSPNLEMSLSNGVSFFESILSGPLASKSQTEKCSYILLYAGLTGREVYNTLTLTEDQKKSTKEVLHAFQKYCIPKKN